MSTPPIRRGTASRLGLRLTPKPAFLLSTANVSDADLERFIQKWNKAHSGSDMFRTIEVM